MNSRWLDGLSSEKAVKENNAYYWGNDASTLITTSNAVAFTARTGLDIYRNTLLPAIESAEHDVLLVTCFWARSSTLSDLCTSLRYLSRKALSRGDGTRIRIRFGFSSRSPFQMLFHTSSPSGYIYLPSTWASKLGLPPPEELQGLDLQVKSIFNRPFSVMHPKFVIVDGAIAFMPSCNVSWESWFECCIAFDGSIVSKLLKFHENFWGTGDLGNISNGSEVANRPTDQHRTVRTLPRTTSAFACFPSSPLPSILLPSPHHTALHYLLPFIHTESPPPTPLNVFLQQLFLGAQSFIQILTPNLTSPPVLSALLSALERGIDVNIITNRRMMLLEQLVTAGTITEICIWRLVRAYRQLRMRKENAREATRDARLEEGRSYKAVGDLKVRYFCAGHLPGTDEQVLKSHIKCTIVDGETIVLGSGNMDRASWFTSQELGIALYGTHIVQGIWNAIEERLQDNLEIYFPKEEN
ncbi:hypothetical protein MMC24_001879 [Lignoscripta atroalba]|nr:hypothetical protein [Lignoscripta atroalba]